MMSILTINQLTTYLPVGFNREKTHLSVFRGNNCPIISCDYPLPPNWPYRAILTNQPFQGQTCWQILFVWGGATEVFIKDQAGEMVKYVNREIDFWVAVLDFFSNPTKNIELDFAK